MSKLETSAKDVKGFLFSETSVTVYSAILATPVVLGIASQFHVDKFPTWLVLVVLGFIFFLVSSQLKGYPRAIFQGISIGIFLNALFSTQFGAKLSARIGGITQSG